MRFSDFFFYSSDFDDIVQQVNSDLTILLTQVVNSQFHDRTKGLGLDYLENEVVTIEEFIALKLNIINALISYNDSVNEDKKIIVSQDWIEADLQVDQNGLPAVRISVMYVLKKMIKENAEIQKLELVVGV